MNKFINTQDKYIKNLVTNWFLGAPYVSSTSSVDSNDNKITLYTAATIKLYNTLTSIRCTIGTDRLECVGGLEYLQPVQIPLYQILASRN